MRFGGVGFGGSGVGSGGSGVGLGVSGFGGGIRGFGDGVRDFGVTWRPPSSEMKLWARVMVEISLHAIISASFAVPCGSTRVDEKCPGAGRISVVGIIPYQRQSIMGYHSIG